MIKQRRKRLCGDCGKKASHQLLNDRMIMRCEEHLLPDMRKIGGSECKRSGCINYPRYNYPGEKSAKYCYKHHKSGMINVIEKRCSYDNCQIIRPCFNYPSESNGVYCNQHKLEGMENLTSYRCKECQKLPRYGYPNEKVSTHCAEHKLQNMINLLDVLCQSNNCKKRANYGYLTNKKKLFCKDHKKDDMINLINDYCDFSGCKVIQPRFNFKEYSYGKYCEKHKINGMINIYQRECEENECLEKPCFNFDNLEFPIYCNKHKKDGMVDLNINLCHFCRLHASYGYPGSIPVRCYSHKNEFMMRNPQNKCKKCDKVAILGLSINQPIACEEHKEKDFINLIENKCKNCGLFDILGKNGVCFYCVPHRKYPSHDKQNRIEKFLIQNNYIIESIDKMIDKGQCNKYRPDFVINCDSHYIVIEVDENQHVNYNSNGCDENIRMINISQSLGMPTVFIRYNPDSYIKNGIRYCPDITERTSILKKSIDDTKNMIPHNWKGYCCVIYLFYDDYNYYRCEMKPLIDFNLKII